MISLFSIQISFIILDTWLSPVHSQDQPRPTVKEIAIEDLPTEARTTLPFINQGAPFPYQRDGAVFGNLSKCDPDVRFSYCVF
jgi:ribonuclease T1